MWVADQEDIKEWMRNNEEEEFTEDNIIKMVTNEADRHVNNKNKSDRTTHQGV